MQERLSSTPVRPQWSDPPCPAAGSELPRSGCSSASSCTRGNSVSRFGPQARRREYEQSGHGWETESGFQSSANVCAVLGTVCARAVSGDAETGRRGTLAAASPVGCSGPGRAYLNTRAKPTTKPKICRAGQGRAWGREGSAGTLDWRATRPGPSLPRDACEPSSGAGCWLPQS